MVLKTQTGNKRLIEMEHAGVKPENPTAWRPRRLEPGEMAARKRIASRFPGRAAGFALDGLARLLGLDNLRLFPSTIIRSPFVPPDGVVLIAISQKMTSGTFRAVLCLPVDLAHHIVDSALGRKPSRADRVLTSGEQGALLYALDRAGGDWLAAGGAPFVLRGFLADTDQISDYLGGALEWRVRANIAGDKLSSAIDLYFRDPVPPVPHVNDFTSFFRLAADWTVVLRISVGWSCVPADQAADLGVGDVILLDGGSHPARNGDIPFTTIRCGEWKRSGRWLDLRRIEVVSKQELGVAMETQAKGKPEVAAILEQSIDEVGSMEVVVQVEIGELNMTVEQASGLVPGQILRLDRDVGPEVVLRVGKKCIGRGELVDQEGILAVEVKEVL
ncbi:MAG: hypothetical protein GY847_40230 [Proteobacteria bacterium]|nr:hypothetical protein [Pseudomonadota bacterium]